MRKLTFKPDPQKPDSFSAYYQAENYLKSRGFTVGSMQGDNPIGFKKDVAYVAKWTNISFEDREYLDGIIESKNFMQSEVIVTEYIIGEE